MANRFYNFMKTLLSRVSFSSYVLLAAAIFIVFINPAVKLLPTGCIFKKLTGYYCAGCGLTTGLYFLFNGDITGAMSRNILIVTLIPAAFLYYIVRKILITFSDYYSKRYDLYVILFFTFSVIAFTVMRNIPYSFFYFLRPH